MTAIYWLNRLLGNIFSVLVFPFARLDPIWSLLFISLLAAVLMIWIFGKVSNQPAIRRIKNKLFGALIGVRLYRHDLGVVLRLQCRILLDTLVYMRYSLAPLLVMLVPLLLIMIQMNRYYELRPLRAGEAAIVKARIGPGFAALADWRLLPSEGVAVETPPVRIGSLNEVNWRVRAKTPGTHELTFLAGDKEIRKQVLVSDTWQPISSRRAGASLSEALLYPGEPPIDNVRSVRSISVAYPLLALTIFGWRMHWLVIFFVFSLLFGYALKGFFKVEI